MDENSIKFFDNWAFSYEKFIADSPYYEVLISKLVDSLNINKNDNVLDIGIGTGNIAFRLIKKYGCKVSGIDISDNMLNRCKENVSKQGVKIECRTESIEKTSFENESFNCAVAGFAIHHIPDQNKVKMVREIKRVLKPGGIIGIAEVVVDIDGDTKNPERLKHILERWGNAALIALKNGGPELVTIELEAIKSVYLRYGEHLVSKDKWCSLFEDEGFSLVSSECTNQVLGHWMLLFKKGKNT